MSLIVVEDRLLEAIGNETFIVGGHPSCAEGVKYDFRMGTDLLKGKFGRPVDMAGLAPEEEKDLFVEPGEMVFVLTEEKLNLPDNMMAILSPKRKLSHLGIVILGGFCIDPLYSGKLLIGLYNLSSTRFLLRPGKKLIAAVFYILTNEEKFNFQKPEVSIEEFPDDLVQIMQRYEHATVQSLKDLLDQTRTDLNDLRSEITSGREWQQKFQESLDRHDQQIDRLLTGLEEEKTNRTEAEKAFREELKTMQKEVYKMAAKLGAIIGGIILLAGAIVSFFLQGSFLG